MDKNDETYCLLCAQLKRFSELIHLQNDEDKLRKTVEKLSRLNIVYANFDEVLTKAVCYACMESLDKAFEFVVGVEKAQSVLNNIHKNQIKNEKCSSEEDQRNEILDRNSECSIRIKREFDSQSSDDSSTISDDLQIDCKQTRSSKINNRRTSSDVLSLKYLKLTWNDYLWTCAYCETQFSTIEELKVHSMQYHQCCNAFKCNDCNIRKLHVKRFITHIKRHRKYLKLLCYRCNSKFMFAHQLHLHMRNVHAPNTEYTCLGCNAQFQSSDDLNEHNQMFNKDKRVREIPMALKTIDNLTCVICKKTFKTKGNLNTHLLIHTERKREHTCEKCGKCFFNKQNLAGHMLMHDNVRPYHCRICKCSFKTSKQLKSHVGTHNGEKPHTCDQCGRGFRLQRHLNSHKIIHTDSLPYNCNYCSKKFRFKTILNQHLRQHTGVKPYSCDICKRDFTNWPNYNKHMKRRHGLDMAKKKRTSEGVYPINPSTGEIIRHEETNETLEWKNQILQKRDKGRPTTIHISCNESNVLNSENDKLTTKINSS